MENQLDLAKSLTNFAAYLPIIRSNVNSTLKVAENIKDENEKIIFLGHHYMELVENLTTSGIIYRKEDKMNKLILVKSKGYLLLNVNDISTMEAYPVGNDMSLIVSLSSGETVSLCQFRSKNAKTIMNRIIEKIYYKIKDDEDIILIDDIIIEAKKEEDGNK